MTGTEVAVAILALALFVAAAFAPAIYAACRRTMSQASDLLIWPAMRRRGVSPEGAAGRECDILAAAHRCSTCPSTERCAAWLASGEREGLEDFCPNYALIQRLEAKAPAARR